MSNIDQYAVFGHPISHSKSPRIHKLFAEQTGQLLDYKAQEVFAEDFTFACKAFFEKGGKGLNCTVPLKELAWQYADELTERARLAKAVNTLKRGDDGLICGDNTDGIGLVTDLVSNHQIPLTDCRILILGAGGATRGILGPLLACKSKHILIANRTVSKAEGIVADFAEQGAVESCDYPDLFGRQFDLILNATSASLSGELPPLPDKLLADNGSCYDLAYANQPTAFVKWGLNQHAAKSLDGLGMLVEQAAEAFFLWRGVRPQTAAVIKLLNSERQ